MAIWRSPQGPVGFRAGRAGLLKLKKKERERKKGKKGRKRKRKEKKNEKRKRKIGNTTNKPLGLHRSTITHPQ